jgi:HEAT repeat protein
VARAASRKQIEQALVAIIQGGDSALAQLGPYARRARLMAETLLEFLNIIRGQDQERVLAVLRNLRVDATLRRRLNAGSMAGRLACLETLAVFPGPETQAALEKAATSRRPRLRLVAFRSLAAVGGSVTIDRLLDDLLAGDLEPSGLFGEFLRELAAASPASAMRAAARPDLTPAALALVLYALGEAGDYQALPVLVEHAASPHVAVRVAAVTALGRLKHPAAEQALRTALADDAWQVRAASSEAAGAARLARLVPTLAQALGDPVWRVRFQAAASLSKLGPGGVAALQTVADSPLEIASVAASLALAERAA